mmetsp:Transcript_155282/g.498231  ORF Transcript_155282/g.498231 Transcript_155282/m.498231 type:complete len:481 (-) Transcript_155282:154-1596(-)
MQKERIWVDASRLRQPAALVATTDGEFTQSPTPHRRTGRALQCVLFAGVRGAYPDSQCIPQPPAIAGHASGAVVEIALYALAPICLIVVVPAIVIAHVLYLNRILLSIVRIRRILESRQISSQADAYAVRAACVPTAHLQVCLPVATNDLSIEVVAGVAPLAVAIVTADLVLTNASRATAVLQLHAIVYVLAPQVFRPLQVLGACHRGRAPASCAVAAGADDREARRASQHVGHSDLRRARPAPAVVVDVMAHRLDAHSAGSAHALVCRCVRPLWRRRGRLGLGLGRALAFGLRRRGREVLGGGVVAELGAHGLGRLGSRRGTAAAVVKAAIHSVADLHLCQVTLLIPLTAARFLPVVAPILGPRGAVDPTVAAHHIGLGLVGQPPAPAQHRRGTEAQAPGAGDALAGGVRQVAGLQSIHLRHIAARGDVKPHVLCEEPCERQQPRQHPAPQAQGRAGDEQRPELLMPFVGELAVGSHCQ